MYNPSNPKIDIYLSGAYHTSTNWAKTNKEAIDNFKANYPDLAFTFKVTAKRSK